MTDHGQQEIGHLGLIVSKELSPCIEALARWGAEAKSITFIHTDSPRVSREPARRLADLLKKMHGITPNPPLIFTVPEAQHTYDAVLTWAAHHGQEALTLVTNCGTKPMYLGSQLAANKLNGRCRCLYLEELTNTWYQQLGLQNRELCHSEIPANVDTEDFIRAHVADGTRQVKSSKLTLLQNSLLEILTEGRNTHWDWNNLRHKFHTVFPSNEKPGFMFERLVAMLIAALLPDQHSRLINSVKIQKDKQVQREIDLAILRPQGLRLIDCKQQVTDSHLNINEQIAAASRTASICGGLGAKILILRPSWAQLDLRDDYLEILPNTQVITQEDMRRLIPLFEKFFTLDPEKRTPLVKDCHEILANCETPPFISSTVKPFLDTKSQEDVLEFNFASSTPTTTENWMMNNFRQNWCLWISGHAAFGKVKIQATSCSRVKQYLSAELRRHFQAEIEPTMFFPPMHDDQIVCIPFFLPLVAKRSKLPSAPNDTEVRQNVINAANSWLGKDLPLNETVKKCHPAIAPSRNGCKAQKKETPARPLALPSPKTKLTPVKTGPNSSTDLFSEKELESLLNNYKCSNNLAKPATWRKIINSLIRNSSPNREIWRSELKRQISIKEELRPLLQEFPK